MIPCPGNYACDDLGTGCLDVCESDVNCAKGFHCDDDAGENRGDCLQVIDGG